MSKLYPFKFKPIFKDKIWGGDKIKTLLGLDYSPLPNCGEAWMISGVEGNNSIVENGFLAGNELNELIEIYMDNIVGEKIYNKYKNVFPILIKFIDSHSYLSLQVHPNDKLSMKNHKHGGKSEMWYVIQADEGSELISGFKKKTDKKDFLERIKNKSFKEVLNYEKAKADEAFYLPAGRIHALGPGILLAEIQQTSDITYRIHDWDRKDEKGVSRDLHVDQAMEALDFNVYDYYKIPFEKQFNEPSNVIGTPHFTTNLLHGNNPLMREVGILDSFVIYLCIDGAFILKYDNEEVSICKGETVLVPAEMQSVIIIPQGTIKVLEVFISH